MAMETMRVKIIRAFSVFATAVAGTAVISVTSSAWASNTAHTTTEAMPGGAGTIVCTTFNHVSNTANPPWASYKIYRTDCTNKTNRYIDWYESDYDQRLYPALTLYKDKTAIRMNPDGTYSRYWPQDRLAYDPIFLAMAVSSYFKWNNYYTYVENFLDCFVTLKDNADPACD
jgi:hypothetical protein